MLSTLSDKQALGHFGKYHNTLRLPPEFCISIVFVFSWDHCKSQEKLETMLMENLGGQIGHFRVALSLSFKESVSAKLLL